MIRRAVELEADRALLRRELVRFSTLAKTPRLRPMGQFAEEEIRIPDGPFKGELYRMDRQPHSRLWFAEIDSGRWRRHAHGGPVQSGKTLGAYVIPTLYHLFECGETVILGIPTMEMASDKWEMDIEPAIYASRYRDLMPTKGTGSKGGKFDRITFKNGATLKFMSGGGSDKKRAGFTARVLVVTETDGLDEAGKASREADPLKQMEGRTAAYGAGARIYLECTVSLEQGRIWQEIKGGTDSRIALRCPHCHGWSTPERESLVGWQGAPDEVTAYERSAFYCDLCGAMWTEGDRRAAHDEAKLVHKGQEITEDGTITGEAPRTFTLGYRYTAANNFFRSAGEIGAAEWRASKSENEEAADREMCQFVWAKPPKPSIEAMVTLDARIISERCIQPGRGFVPADSDKLIATVDVHKYHLEWNVVAFREGCIGHVVAYGTEPVPTDVMAEETAILTTLRDLRTAFQAGWLKPGVGQIFPRFVLVDSGYNADVVYKFCAESGPQYMATKGQGAGQRATGVYTSPRSTGSEVKYIGEQWHISAVQAGAGWIVPLVLFSADYWKTWLHNRWTTKLGAPGSMELYATANHNDHLGFAKHQTAEEKQVEFVEGKGEVVQWKRIHRANHWFDTMVLACVGGSIAGVSLVSPAVAPAPRPQGGFSEGSTFGGSDDSESFCVLDR